MLNISKQFIHSSIEREKQLLEWTTQKCRDGTIIQFDEGWDVILEYGIDVLRQILRQKHIPNRPFTSYGFASLYTISHKISLSPNPSKSLYNRHKQMIETYLCNDIVPLIVDAQYSGCVMKEFVKSWSLYEIMATWMWRLFMHLDRGVVVENKLPTLTSCCLKAYYDIVYCSVKNTVRRKMLESIELHRKGESPTCDYLKECVKIFEYMGLAAKVMNAQNLKSVLGMPPDLEVYRRDFEVLLLQETRRYYSSQSSAMITDADNVAEYLKLVEQMLLSELRRCREYLRPETTQFVHKVCLEELVMSKRSVLSEGIRGTISDTYSRLYDGEHKCYRSIQYEAVSHHFENLRRMYNIFSQTSHMCTEGDIDRSDSKTLLYDLADEFTRFGVLIRESITRFYTDKREALNVSSTTCNTLSFGAESAPNTSSVDHTSHENCHGPNMKLDLVDDVIYALVLLGDIAKFVFDGNPKFIQATKKASRHVVNCPDDSVDFISIYANFCDKKLRESGSYAEIESFMSTVFTNIDNKDIFLEVYRRLLARRLLSGNSISLDVEKLVVSQMKIQCGTSYTVKLEGMINDYCLSEDIFRAWTQSVESNNRFQVS